MTESTKRIVIITGLSGSGKTVALKALEDSGFFCIDNFPPILLSQFLSLLEKDDIKNIGIGIDVRERPFLKDMESIITNLKKSFMTEIIYLETEKDVIKRRFKETRRRHPLSDDIEGAIEMEKRLIGYLREIADMIIDTSRMTPHELRHLIMKRYSSMDERMQVTLISFGYKYGIPQDVDLLFDVRFLPNPHFVPELCELNGLDPEVRDYVLNKKETQLFFEKLKDLLKYLIPEYIKEGKSYLTIGIGCTGGKHRSPVIVEELKNVIERYPVKLNIIHREI